MGWLKNATGGKIQTPKTGKQALKASVDFMNMGTGIGDKLFAEKAKTPGTAEYDAEQARILAEKNAAYDEFTKGGPAVYEQGAGLEYQGLDPSQLAQLGQSGLGDITNDPQYKNAQLDDLRALEQQSHTGMSPQDEADAARLNGEVGRANSGRIGAIQQNMAARGMGGSGLEMVAQMQSAQAAADREAMAALERGGQAADRRIQAGNQRATLAGNMQRQEYNQKSQAVQANDAIGRFNAQNRVNTQQANNTGMNAANQATYNRTNTTADNNANAKYGFGQDKLNAVNAKTNSQYNVNVDGQNRRDMQAQQASAKQEGMYGAIGGGGGAILGGMAAGPAGAMAGAQVGQQLGKSYQNFAHGGKIPGPEVSPFDDPANDIFQANLSPGEIVIPKSIAQDPQASAQFVAQQNAPKSGSVDPMVLDHLAKNNPDLVAQYRSRMQGAEQGSRDAQDTQKMVGYGKAAGGILNDFNNSQKQDTILHNRMQDLGKSPDVLKASRPEYSDGGSNAMAAQGVSAADKRMAEIKAQMAQDYQVQRDTDKTGTEQSRYEAKQSQDAENTQWNHEHADKVLAQQAEGNRESLEMRLALSGQARTDKAEAQSSKEAEKMDQLKVGDLGYANTADDAKKLKDASVLKDKLNRQLDDMVALRTKHNGGATMNREDVALGKQLATDAKLAYKDLANLGVLSASDKSMLDDILPDDPLEYNVSGLTGQDPTMAKIKNFKAQKNKEFDDSVKTRIRSGSAKPATSTQDYDSMSDAQLEALLKGK